MPINTIQSIEEKIKNFKKGEAGSKEGQGAEEIRSRKKRLKRMQRRKKVLTALQKNQAIAHKKDSPVKTEAPKAEAPKAEAPKAEPSKEENPK